MNVPRPERRIPIGVGADGARPVPAGFFRPQDGAVLIRLALDPSSFERAAVTVELGRAPAPTSDPIFTGTLA